MDYTPQQPARQSQKVLVQSNLVSRHNIPIAQSSIKVYDRMDSNTQLEVRSRSKSRKKRTDAAKEYCVQPQNS